MKEENVYKPESKQEQSILKQFDNDFVKVRDDFYREQRPRFDRNYKMYRAYTGDREAKIKSWQSNVFIPYIFSVVETLMPRIISARPDLLILPRRRADINKVKHVQSVLEYVGDKSNFDNKITWWVKNALLYGVGLTKTRWEKREQQSYLLDQVENLQNVDNMSTFKAYKPEKKLVYDDPQVDVIDPYDFFPSRDGATINGQESIRFAYQRNFLTVAGIREMYPGAKNLQFVRPGLNNSRSRAHSGSGDSRDFKIVRKEVMYNKDRLSSTPEGVSHIEGELSNELVEVIERWEGTRYIVRANGIPIINRPNPYSHAQIPFQKIDFIPLPHEFYSLAVPDIAANTNTMLNTIKNQRIDNVTMAIHKMWIVDPLSNVNNSDLVTKPFGIIYTNNPNGVKPVEFSDIKQSAYLEEDRLKEDMRNATGVDDYSRGVGAIANSATEAAYLREATLERVKLFLDSLSEGYSSIMEQWYSMIRDFYPDEKIVRIINPDGNVEFPVLRKDDYVGEFDFRAAAKATAFASQELKKKQDMDLLQISMQLPQIVDVREVAKRTFEDFGWDPENYIIKDQQQQNAKRPPSMEELAAVSGPQGQPPAPPAPQGGGTGSTAQGAPNTTPGAGEATMGNLMNQSQDL